jgi:PKD repeat protein
MMRSSVVPTGKLRRRIGAILAVTLLVGAVASPARATTTLPVLWTAGGLSAGLDSAGNAGQIAADAAGDVAVASGPSGGRDFAVTSYTATGSLRWRSTISPATGTFQGGLVVAAPNGEFVAVGYNADSHGIVRGSALVRYAADGTLRWRLDLVALVTRLVVDAGGNSYISFGATDVQVQKYSPTGVLLWASGATGTFAASSLALSPDQTDVVVTGSVIGGATWMTAALNAATGARRWMVTAPEGIAALDVKVDASRVYVTGQGNVGINLFLTVVAYDRATGTRLWRTDANPTTCCAIGQRIALAPDGSLVVAGHTATGGYFDWWIVAFDTNGSVKWQALRDAAATGDELPAAVFVLADGTTVVSGTGGPVTRDILGNSYMQGVTAGYGPSGTLLWEAFAKLPTVSATALPSGDVCATGGYDALVTCWRVSGGPGNVAPRAVLSATPLTGVAPLIVNFDSSGSSDPDGTISSRSWSFGDGTTSVAAAPSHTYANPGTYTATLTVTDNGNASASGTVAIVVNPAASTALRSTAITLSATRQGQRVSVTGNVVVKDSVGAAISGAVVSATWTSPGGAQVAKTATTGSTGIARFTTTGGRGTYTLTVGTISKTGFTFDAANSVLTRSITK